MSDRQQAEAEILNDDNAQRRFWSYVNKGDSCWNWALPTKRKGYGLFGMKAFKQYSAHRISWILHHRKSIPIGLLICHHCDNPSCVNPDHLFIGTALDNNRDRDRKGRFTALRGSLNGNTIQTCARGEKISSAKLTNAEVLEIRRRHGIGESAVSIAKSFNFSPRGIGLIVNRHTWTHI